MEVSLALPAEVTALARVALQEREAQEILGMAEMVVLSEATVMMAEKEWVEQVVVYLLEAGKEELQNT